MRAEPRGAFPCSSTVLGVRQNREGRAHRAHGAAVDIRNAVLPILLPGNPTAGSVIMTADAGAHVAAYSVNHGAGRCMGRKMADRTLDQRTVDDEFTANDILTNCRQYPKDEAPAAYKDFDAVLDSVKVAGLASEVARLKARFVIKDSDSSLRGAA
jgi:tRNA-splicing ligase RtcB